jgi:hypothetical protein
MQTISKVAVALLALAGAGSTAMADKTYNSDPSTYDTDASREWVDPADTQPVQAEPSEEAPAQKSYKLYKAPKAEGNGGKKSGD